MATPRPELLLPAVRFASSVALLLVAFSSLMPSSGCCFAIQLPALPPHTGDCSKFKTNIPHCCRKDPEVVDLLPGTPYNMQIANCCKGGVLTSWAQDPNNAVASFQVSVGQAGTTNRTVKLPKNFILQAPGPGYTCGTAKLVKPTKFITQK